MSSHTSKTTTDHNEIRRWAEARNAKPACVKGTGSKGEPGMIRLDFPGFSGSDSLQSISWDEWFRAFDDNDLALVYQDTTADGARSNFNKLVSRSSASGSERNRDHESGSHSDSRSSRSGHATTSVRDHGASARHASGSSDASFKEREYRDAEGGVHHHTHVYMDEHRNDAKRKRR